MGSNGCAGGATISLLSISNRQYTATHPCTHPPTRKGKSKHDQLRGGHHHSVPAGVDARAHRENGLTAGAGQRSGRQLACWERCGTAWHTPGTKRATGIYFTAAHSSSHASPSNSTRHSKTRVLLHTALHSTSLVHRCGKRRMPLHNALHSTSLSSRKDVGAGVAAARHTRCHVGHRHRGQLPVEVDLLRWRTAGEKG